MLQVQAQRSTVDGMPPCEVVSLNLPAAAYILANKLYNRVALIKMVTSANGLHLPGGRPNPSREIKTEWRPVSPSQFSRYIVAVDVTGKPYGLVAIHLMTHEAPYWTWATWIHIDYAKKYVPRQFMHDSFGIGKDGRISDELKKLLQANNEPFLGSYLLIGSQTGPLAPKYLSNPMMEGPGFQTYSCISCHAYSAITSTGDWAGPPASSAVGVVHVPKQFYRLDFDFSLAALSKCKSGTIAVPANCNNLLLATR
jgi:hypothetical protein